MAHWRSVVVELGAVALLVGCSISELSGELTPGDCSDGSDNDGDGPADCMDPDCQAFDVCGHASSLRDASWPQGQIGDAYVSGPIDAGWSGPSSMAGRPASTPPEDPVAPSEPQPSEPEDPPVVGPTCAGGCGDNQTCVEGYCLDNDVVVVELWDITRIDVTVPRSVPQADTAGSACLDDGLGECLGSFDPLFWLCSCPPDPKVQVFLDQDPSDAMPPQLLATTDRKRSVSAASWSDLDITLGLLPGSKIHLKALDDDGDAGDQLIFGCELPATPVLNGDPLECTKSFPPDSIAAEEFSITAQVAPTQATPE